MLLLKEDGTCKYTVFRGLKKIVKGKFVVLPSDSSGDNLWEQCSIGHTLEITC